MIEQLVFFLFAFVIVASALAVVGLKNIFHCALFLILCLFSVAGIYVLLHAEFVAVVQVLLYVGAVSILIIFAIMLTARLMGRSVAMTNEQTFIGAFLSVLVVLGTILSFKATHFRISSATPAERSSFEIGRLLMTEYVMPFEIVSVLLLAALIGAVIIARREGN